MTKAIKKISEDLIIIVFSPTKLEIFFRVIFQQKIHLQEQRTQRNLMLILLLQNKIKNHQHQITMIQFQMILCENIPVINVVNLFLQGKSYIYIKNLKDNMFYIYITMMLILFSFFIFLKIRIS